MRRCVGAVLLVLGLGLVLVANGALVAVDGGTGGAEPPPAGRSPAGARPGDVEALQQRLRQVPGDDSAWAMLGVGYIERAKVTASPELYAKAEGALHRSLRVRATDNYLADAGLAALANARHDFATGRTWAQRGLAINPASAALYGTLVDADTQLGRYQDAWQATQRMVDLSPDAASLARVSYSWELRGDLVRATELMQRALDSSATPAQQAFARYHLGDLALLSGDPVGALAQYEAGLHAEPNYTALLEGRARAKAAMGRSDEALADMAAAVERAPQPAYVLAYGEMLESRGRTNEARQQYDLFGVEQRLFKANGVVVDVEAATFEADHRDPRRAVALAEAGVRSRPFLDMQATYAWALYRAGQLQEAAQAIAKARALGTKDPLLEFRTGMIERSLGHLDAAGAHLGAALAMNPAFHPLHAVTARAVLAELGPG